MAGNLDLKERIDEREKTLTSREQPLGKELVQPMSNCSSSSRKIMFSTHSEQAMALCNPEMPIIQTGYENEYGRHSTSFRTADEDILVLDKVEKYGMYPGHEYFLIVYKRESNKLDVIHKYDYFHITETFGYKINTELLDSLVPGSTIHKGQVITKSGGFDEYNNRMDGINAMIMYIAQNKTTEDAIQISESCAKKFRSPLIKKVSFIINENDILLNLYGNEIIYKVIPDIGEDVQEGILAAVRREDMDEALYSQVFSKLKDINMSDEKITSSGKVIGIDLHVNNPKLIAESQYLSQLNIYYEDNLRFYNELISKVERLSASYNCPIDFDLQKLVYTGRQVLDGVKFKMDKNIYSNLHIDIYLLDEKDLSVGDKLTNRYGGKGVISSIIPDELMPITEDGDRVEMKYNQATVVNRLNPAQLLEMELNSASAAIIRNLDRNDAVGSLRKIIRFVELVTPLQAQEMRAFVDSQGITGKQEYLDSIISDGNIALSIQPMVDSVTLNTIRAILREFPETRHKHLYVPMKDSNGNYKMRRTHRPAMVAKQYTYRLKQYAEEKFSATSMSFSNNRGENSRNKSSGLYKPVYTNTPIRQGEMEIGTLTHIGDDINSHMLMIYSSSTTMKKEMKSLLTDDPTVVDIVLKDDARSRPAQIVHTYLKAMGLGLSFRKVKRKLTPAIIEPAPIVYDSPFINNKEYLKQLRSNKPEDMNIELVKGEDGKMYPKYTNFKEPLRQSILYGAIKKGTPSDYELGNPYWFYAGLSMFKKRKRKIKNEDTE